MAALTDGLGLLRSAISYALASARLAGPELLARPTPCADWDLRRLLEHLSDSADALNEAMCDGYVGPGRSSGAARPDPVASLRRDAIRLLGTCAACGLRDRMVAVADRELATSTVVAAGAVEIAVHGWDIGVTCGGGSPIPPRLATGLLRLVPLLIAPGTRRGLFASPVAPPVPSSPSDRLVAYLGRPPAIRHALAPR